MMRRVILIGPAPGRADHLAPFDNVSGDRLARLCGVSRIDFLARFTPTNLIETWPGRRGHGDDFDRIIASTKAFYLELLHDDADFIMAGRNVARAFSVTAGWFEIGRLTTGQRFVLSPHPSGVSHFWNDPANVRLAAGHWRTWYERGLEVLK